MDSILTSTKKLLGIEADYTHFDTDIIIHINTVLMTLTQIGVGPAGGFAITGADEKWSDFLPEAELIKLQAVKTYLYLKVKLIFDPPLSSSVMEAMNRKADELEWRLNVVAETK